VGPRCGEPRLGWGTRAAEPHQPGARVARAPGTQKVVLPVPWQDGGGKRVFGALERMAIRKVLALLTSEGTRWPTLVRAALLRRMHFLGPFIEGQFFVQAGDHFADAGLA
jgi:hypothetical protein